LVPEIKTLYFFIVPSSAVTVYSTFLLFEKSCLTLEAGVTTAFSDTVIEGNKIKASLAASLLTLKVIVPFSSSITGCSVTTSLSNVKPVILASELSLPVNLVPTKVALTSWFKGAPTFTPISILILLPFTVPKILIGQLPRGATKSRFCCPSNE